ncbi:hypothetical protein DFH06DRAFT_1485045 [Mycena polygramma]|nr:hypothetical protein DFH06DRAFT_1485045 [Mycena polygramma]
MAPDPLSTVSGALQQAEQAVTEARELAEERDRENAALRAEVAALKVRCQKVEKELEDQKRRAKQGGTASATARMTPVVINRSPPVHDFPRIVICSPANEDAPCTQSLCLVPLRRYSAQLTSCYTFPRLSGPMN